ncbi:MAG: tetratricopeptide repeat protein [Caldilineales bacterium]
MENPAAYIPIDRRHALARGQELPERAAGAALFADISGFTPLTERLARALGAQRGAEELTVTLNRVYDALIAEVHRFGGSVLGFSGDAITCWFDGDDGLRAVAAALALHAAMSSFASPEAPGEGAADGLAVKVAVAAGSVRRFVVGDPEHTLVDVIAGETLDRLADAEHAAERGEIILDGATAGALAGQIRVAGWRQHTDHGGVTRFAVVAGLSAEVSDRPWPSLAREALKSQTVGQWLLPAVHERLRRGRGEFLAELRPAAALFLRFGGIDYDRDPAAPQKLDAFIRRVQQILREFDGSLIQLTVGDKGSYLYAAFGAPIAHEDDVDRAAAAALRLQDLAREFAYLEPLQIGITYGRMRVGAYGSVNRRTYGVLGDATNLSARLMQAAPPGVILVSDEALQRAGAGFLWERLPAIRVKGKSEPVALNRLVGLKAQSSVRLLEPRYALPMVGRQAELAQVDEKLAQASAGKGQIVAITAEAGMGKSRLVAEVVRLALARGLAGFAGEAQSFGTRTPFLAWQGVWRGLLGIDAESPPDDQIAQAEAALRRLDPRTLPRLPLLGSVLNLPLADNDLTGSLSAKLRKTARENLLVDLLAARAGEGPLLLVLDDCHWLDPMSFDLLAVLGRAVHKLPVLLLLVYRPLEGPETLPVTQLPWFSEIRLGEFTAAEAGELIRLKLARLFGQEEAIPDQLVEAVTVRAGGNPFYIDELINYLHDQGIRLTGSESLSRFDLPTSLQSLILSRIDRLTEGQKAAIKVASVIGRLFQAALLLGVYPELGERARVRHNLEVLSDLELTPLDTPDPELTYIFKHVVTQEVAYESLLYRTRAHLHAQIGRYLEAHQGAAAGQLVHLLAFHFDRGDDEDKRREYLVKAGQAAQADYANTTAIDYYLRALPLLSGLDHVRVLRRLGEVFEVVGDWAEAESRYREALHRAEESGDRREQGWCEIALSELFRKRGQFEPAARWRDQAQLDFEAAGCQDGAAKVLICAGTLASQQGDYDPARDLYQQSLEVRREMDDKRGIANILNNLGIVARRQGDLQTARGYQEESLALRRELNDRWAIAMSLNNLGNVLVDLGDVAQAQGLLEEAVAIQREIGDRWAVGNALNNLGNAARNRADWSTAAAAYRESLAIYDDLRDKWALAYLLEDIGWLLAQRDNAAAALKLAGAAATLRDEIGAPLTATEAAALEAGLAPAPSPDPRCAVTSGRVGPRAVADRRDPAGCGPALTENRKGDCHFPQATVT